MPKTKPSSGVDMQVWFYNTRFSVRASETSEAMAEALDALAFREPKEMSCLNDHDMPGKYNIRFGLIGVNADSPLGAYRLLLEDLCGFDDVSFDSYTIGNLTVHFNVEKYLQHKED